MYKNFSSTNTYCDILKIYIYTSNLFLTFLSIFLFKGVRLLISQSHPPQKNSPCHTQVWVFGLMADDDDDDEAFTTHIKSINLTALRQKASVA